MSNNTIFETEETIQDEYDEGYEEGIKKALYVIDNCLRQEQLDTIPTSWMLKVIRHTLQAGD